MRIAVLNAQVPFTTGGAEALADGLVASLKAHGHQAEIVSIPFRWYPAELVLDHMLANRLLNLDITNGARIDLAIGLKFPAYLIPHPRKVLWLLHQFRQAYDLWGTPFGDLEASPCGMQVRDAVREADRACFTEAKRIFTTSRTVAERLKRFNDVTGDPLYHPPPHMQRFYSGGCGGYFYYPSRLNALKRQELVLRALAKCRHDVHVVFAGPVENAAELEGLQRQAARLQVEHRVTWKGRVEETEKFALYAGCRAVLFTGWNEDYGYVPLEGMFAGKAVVTCTDSGGGREFVLDGETGLIAEAEPLALAEALDRLWLDPSAAVRMGNAGAAHVRDLDLSWNPVVERLLG